jgi:hypothetical protein
MLKRRRTFGPHQRAALFFFVMCVVGPACHTSCTEETGAAPVVEVDAAPVIGAQHPSLQRRPVIKPITPLSETAAPSSSTP